MVFMPTHYGAETDLRFVFCAVAICFLLGNWSGLDREKAKDYIIECQSYDGGFGLIPGSESHVTSGSGRCFMFPNSILFSI
nr:geranylgeranyl transferase type-1 subunit beta-like isoform X2 [Coffea arabica]